MTEYGSGMTEDVRWVGLFAHWYKRRFEPLAANMRPLRVHLQNAAGSDRLKIAMRGFKP